MADISIPCKCGVSYDDVIIADLIVGMVGILTPVGRIIIGGGTAPQTPIVRNTVAKSDLPRIRRLHLVRPDLIPWPMDQ